jgi:hypothetical protein
MNHNWVTKIKGKNNKKNVKKVKDTRDATKEVDKNT